MRNGIDLIACRRGGAGRSSAVTGRVRGYGTVRGPVPPPLPFRPGPVRSKAKASGTLIFVAAGPAGRRHDAHLAPARCAAVSPAVGAGTGEAEVAPPSTGDLSSRHRQSSSSAATALPRPPRPLTSGREIRAARGLVVSGRAALSSDNRRVATASEADDQSAGFDTTMCT